MGDDAARLRGPRLCGISPGESGPRNARRLARQPRSDLVYCSPECKQKLWTRRSYQSRKARGLKQYVARERASNWPTCQRCGNPFHSVRQDARFCSGKCRQAHWRTGNTQPV